MPNDLLLLLLAAAVAGVQNALAGGGSFVTFPALLLAGLDVRAANVTSTVALAPSQVAVGWTMRGLAQGTAGLPLRTLCWTSLAGGAAGAVLLLATPVAVFARLVPWLVLFATLVYGWGSFLRRPGSAPREMPYGPAVATQFAVACYGGYFGGGIGFLILATLAVAGHGVRAATATKNLLVGVLNAAAALVFVLSRDVHWVQAAVVCAGSLGGGLFGAWALRRIPERWIRIGTVCVGLALTVGLFLRQG